MFVLPLRLAARPVLLFFCHCHWGVSPPCHPSPSPPPTPAKGNVSSMRLWPQMTIDLAREAFEIHVLKKNKGIKVKFKEEACSMWTHRLASKRPRQRANRQRKREVHWRVVNFLFLSGRMFPPPMNIKDGLLPLFIPQLFLRCSYLHLYCRSCEWLSLFNIVGAEGPDEVTLGQKVCSDVWQAGEFLNKCW